MRRRNQNAGDPLAQRELAAIDTALAGEPVGAGDQEIADLVRELRGLRPQGSEAFLHRLDQRVAAGFGSGTANGSARARLVQALSKRATRRLLAAMAAAASLLVGLVVAGAVLRSGVASRPDGGAAPSTQPRSFAPVPGRASGEGDSQPQRTSVPPITPGGGALPGRRDRRVERQASLILTTAPERIGEVADGVIRLTDRVNGIVASSSVESTDNGGGGATFDLRVPVGRLRETLSELSKLAHVRARTQSSQDVTSVYASAQERMRDALAERSSLLRQLAAADTANESESVRARLRIVNGEINRARAELARVGERTVYSAVAVTIEPGDEVGGADGWSLRDALQGAGEILKFAAAVLVIALALLIPLAVCWTGVWYGVRALRRRSRERVLEDA